jgi:hypothetical protein
LPCCSAVLLLHLLRLLLLLQQYSLVEVSSALGLILSNHPSFSLLPQVLVISCICCAPWTPHLACARRWSCGPLNFWPTLLRMQTQNR